MPERVIRPHGLSNASFFRWWATYCGMHASLISEMKAIEGENRGLKRRYADPSQQAGPPKEGLANKGSVAQIVREALRGSKVLVGVPEQVHTSVLPHDKLAFLQFRLEAARIFADLI